MLRPSPTLATAFSVTQCVGYAAFLLGVSAFLQKNDRRLKALNGAESLVYAVHFALLGNMTACASTVVSGIRSLLAVKLRSPFLAAAIIIVNVALGFIFGRGCAGWLPVIASCAATLAILLMSGIKMRLVLLGCTLLWLVNNILSGSIGGTLLEAVIATINTATIAQMLKADSEIRELKEDVGTLK